MRLDCITLLLRGCSAAAPSISSPSRFTPQDRRRRFRPKRAGIHPAGYGISSGHTIGRHLVEADVLAALPGVEGDAKQQEEQPVQDRRRAASVKRKDRENERRPLDEGDARESAARRQRAPRPVTIHSTIARTPYGVTADGDR